MKVNLNIIQRLSLHGVLPKAANVVSLKTVRRIREKTSISAEEAKETGLEFDGAGGVKIDNSARALSAKEYDFEAAELDLIKEQLRELNNTNKLDLRTLELYEVFVEEQEQP